MTDKKLSQMELADALGLSNASITKCKKLGMPVHSIEAARAWRTQKMSIAQRKPEPKNAPVIVQRFAASPPKPAAYQDYESRDADSFGGGPLESHDDARTRLRISEANLSEMKEKEEAGELIRAESVRLILASAFAIFRESMQQFSPRLSPLLAAETKTHKVAEILDAEVHATLTQLASANIQPTKTII